MAYSSIRPGQIWLDTNGKPERGMAAPLWFHDNRSLAMHGFHCLLF